MGTQHVVEQGEHLSRIAAAHGFRSFRTIWDHADNAALRQLRASPNILLPGDEVAIPDHARQQLPAATDRSHTFVVPSRALMLRIALLDFHARPRASLACRLEVAGRATDRVTSDAGLIEQAIPVDAESGLLDVALSPLPLHIGHLDPVDCASGWQARLVNLGYLDCAIPCEDPLELRSALEEFQCDQGMPLTGAADADTLAALEAVHGC
jgi:hypothetical protein